MIYGRVESIHPALRCIVVHTQDDITEEIRGFGVRHNGLQLLHAVVIEGRIDHTILHPGLLHDGRHLFLDLRVPVNPCFQFNVDCYTRWSDRVEHLSQGRYARVPILREALPEDHHLLQLLKGEVLDEATLPGDTIHRFIMDDHRNAVLRQLYVQLDAIRALFDGEQKCFECVLRCITARASVCKNFCLTHVLPLINRSRDCTR